LKQSLFLSIFTIMVFAAAALAQSDAAKPRPLLVGLIGKETQYSRTASPTPTNNSLGSATETEARTWELMNARRISAGLPTLQWDEQLVGLARMHSASMASGKYFSHQDQQGGFVDDRASRLGINNWLAIGENIAFMKGYPDPASMAVEKWMLSPSHKKNILNTGWRQSAIGMAVADDGAVYFTQVFMY
jgi:uncharacterized protein YkwD